MVEDRVARREDRVAFAAVGEDPRGAGRAEDAVDLGLAAPLLFEGAVAVGVAHRLPHDLLAFFGRRVLEEHLGRTVLGVHLGLDDRAQLFEHRLLGVLLHRGVDRGIDFQPVLVDVVGRAVGLRVLVAPAVDRVVLVLLDGLLVIPFGVEVAALGGPGVHHLPQHLAEVGRLPVVVRDGAVVERNGQRRERVALGVRDGARFGHAREHEVATGHGVVVVAHRRVARRCVDHAHQHGGLLQVELVGRFVEEGVRRRLDAVGVRSVLHDVEVHRGDLLLGVVVFEFERRDPLLEFRQHELAFAQQRALAAYRVAREEVLGQLLRDGRSSACRTVLQEDRLHPYTDERRDVDARMRVEAGVLGGDERRDDRRHFAAVDRGAGHRVRGEQLLVLHVGTVLHEEGSQHLAVLGVDLRGDVAARVLQLFERGHAPEGSQRRQGKHRGQQYEGCEGRIPQPFHIVGGRCALRLLFHVASAVFVE